MKKVLKTSLSVALLFTLIVPVVTAATDNSSVTQFTEVKTSGALKTKVGAYQGDNTIIIDPKGNKTTVGELKKLTSFYTTKFSKNTLQLPLQTVPQTAQVTPLSTDYGRAQPYYQQNSQNINCYGYAAGFPWAMNPGDGDNVSNVNDAKYFTDVNYTAGLVVKDGNTNALYFKAPWRILASRTSSVNSDEHRIAFRIGWIDANNNGKVDLSSDVVDYHFMTQNDTGKWSEKHGQLPSINTAISDPSNFSWDLGPYSNFYNSSTVYIAIRHY
ncbi:hypothetical protein [Paenibacillus taiwanensis]|uniref:hypothetical protein n=1 Tax=Paenibacillus taiwanensis TaxID=401638 RepID=UPI00041814BE|nr:hypothetical protein [Paenibacillus taiwanensis]